MMLLIDIKPERSSPFIHSKSEPFSEEGVQDEVLHNWLGHFGLKFHQLHASGHLDKQGVERVVKEIDAKGVFPVHTGSPAAFKKFCKNVEIAEREKEYTV